MRWIWIILFAAVIAGEAVAIDVSDYGAIGDATNFVATVTSNSTTVVVTSGPSFSSADAGKLIQVFGAGANTIGTNCQDYIGTLQSVSGTSLTVTPALGYTGTAVGWVASNNINAFSNAVLSASGQVTATINIPAGRFLMVGGPVLTNWSMTDYGTVRGNLVINRGGLTFQGAGRDSTVLMGNGAWTEKGSYAYRGNLIYVQGPVTNSNPLILNDLTLDGGVFTALQTSHDFPASTTDGTGWDVTHDAVLFAGSAPLVSGMQMNNVGVVHWLGEALKSVAFLTDGWNVLTNCAWSDNNASCYNMSFSHLITGCQFVNSYMVEEYWKGYATQPSWFVGNLVSNVTSGLVINGELTNHTSQNYYVSNNFVWTTRFSLFASAAKNLIVVSNSFLNASQGISTSSAGFQGSDSSANWDIHGNTFTGIPLPFSFSNGTNAFLSGATIYGNTATGVSVNFANGNGFLTNVVFSSNTSDGLFGLDSSAMQYQWLADDPSNAFPWHQNGDFSGVTNTITYARGLRQLVNATKTNSVWMLDDATPAKIPAGSFLIVTNSATTPVYLYASSAAYPYGQVSKITKGGAAHTYLWTGAGWQDQSVMSVSALTTGALQGN